MQIIIIDSAEALAEKIVDAIQRRKGVSMSKAVLSCLHPIEVPSDAGDIAEMARDADIGWDGGYYINYKHTPDEITALITAHSRTVPREMLEALWDEGHFTVYSDSEERNACGDEIAVAVTRIAEQFGYRAE